MSADVTAAQAAPATTGPITDVSYRGYDGPICTRRFRWAPIALALMRGALRKWWFWLVFLLSLGPYFFFAFMMYIQDRVAGPNNPMGGMLVSADPATRFPMLFFTVRDAHLLGLMVLGLLVGAASIADDNKTNALLVYLSKPIRKADYVAGKWMGVFGVVFMAAALPSLLLYLYCFFTYVGVGFLKNDPWLLFQLLGACAVAAAGLASMMVGISAWCRSALIAGAAQAGAYVGSGVVSGILWLLLYHGDLTVKGFWPPVLQHASIGGVISAVMWRVLDATVTQTTMHRGRGIEQVTLQQPDLWLMLGAYAALIVAGIVAARMRIRAVEVVRG